MVNSDNISVRSEHSTKLINASPLSLAQKDTLKEKDLSCCESVLKRVCRTSLRAVHGAIWHKDSLTCKESLL